MKHRTQIDYMEGQKSQIWDHWQLEDSFHEIAQLFDRYHSSVREILAASGGIRTPVRQRSPRALTLTEREVMSRALVAAHSPRPNSSSAEMFASDATDCGFRSP
jgi:hypothetical protein